MDKDQQENTVEPVMTIFFSRTYDEALALVKEARSYIAGPGHEAAKTLSQEATFTYATESLRMTTRLTEIMSWLMFQRALHCGEITEQEAQAEECRLQFSEVCLADVKEADFTELPAGLLALMERSESLYRRVARLDQQDIDAFHKRHA